MQDEGAGTVRLRALLGHLLDVSSLDGERKRRGTERDFLSLVSPRSCRIRASAHGFIPWQLGSTPKCPDTLLLKLPTSCVSGRLRLPPSSLPAWFTEASEEPHSSRPLSCCGEQCLSLKPGKAVSWVAESLSSWRQVCAPFVHPRALPFLRPHRALCTPGM